MKEKQDKIKDLFSSKLSGFEPEVPASIWGELDQILSEVPPNVVPLKKKPASRVKLLKFAGIAACVVAIIAIAATIIIAPSDDMKIEGAKSLLGDIVIPEKKEIIAEKKKIVRRKYVAPEKEVEKPVVVENVLVANKIVKKRESLYARSRVDDIYYLDENGLTVKEEVVTARRGKGGLYTRSAEEKAAKQKEENTGQNGLMLSKQSSSRFAVGIVSNLGLVSDNIAQKEVMLFSNDLIKKSHPVVYDMLDKYNSDYELDHDIPISFGLTFSKSILSSRFSVATGLTYTYLSSTIRSSESVFVREKQSFSYLGIPLSLNYTFANVGNAEFYASLSVLAQKDIHGSYKSSLSYSNKNEYDYSSDYLYGLGDEYSLKESIHQDKIQFSGHLTVGAAYPIYGKLYLYGTVGGAYYFDANNKYRTIYSDRQTQLDLNFGLRLGF